MEEAGRERAVTQERDRLAADLHDTAGQLFIALGLLAGRLQEQLPAASPLVNEAARLVQLAESGKKQIEQVVRALAFVPAKGRGLVSSLRALTRSVAMDSGLDLAVDVTGRPVRLSPEAEQALFRVAAEAITNAWRHAHCSQIRCEVGFAPDEVVLAIIDDGVGIRRAKKDDGLHVGITGMRRAMAEVSGSVRIGRHKPKGTAVIARVPRDAA